MNWNIFKRKHPARLVYRKLKNGRIEYQVETWQCYENGCYYAPSFKGDWTEDKSKAEALLREISGAEIIETGVVKKEEV
jgi:hypothetical protein